MASNAAPTSEQVGRVESASGWQAKPCWCRVPDQSVEKAAPDRITGVLAAE